MPSPAHDKPSFALIWQRYSQQILAGRSDVDVDGQQTPIYTLVSRLPVPLVETIQRSLNPRGHDWEGHYVYPPSTVHMTWLFLSPYLGITSGMAENEERDRITRTRQIVEETLGDVGPVRLRARGLNVFPTTVFVQLLQTDPQALCTVRRELANRLKAAGFTHASPRSYERALVWHLAFANLVRFRRPAAPSIVLAARDLREADFGEVCFESVEFVNTDKMLSPDMTVCLDRFELRSAA